MKLQHLTVIFVIIMLPISLIISAYTQMQIDTLTVQNQYDAKLMDATYDAIKAFDMNTTINNTSNVADTLRQDIEAAISTFMTSLASSMGVPGSADRFVRPYVPAILFTLYDGYYIYAPTLTNDGYIYTLQPYNYYSARYKHGSTDVVVNYTLDNYIVIYGNINGKYTVKSGYLVASSQSVKTSESLIENLPVAQLRNNNIESVQIQPAEVTSSEYNELISENGKYLYERNELYYVDPQSAQKYYNEAIEFTEWVKTNLGSIQASDAIRNGKAIEEFENDNSKIFEISANNDPNDIESNFTHHRMEIIKNTIQDNLNYVITAYANSAGADKETSYNFRLPEIDADEWVRIASNICMVPFVQGMPAGTKYYNNYTVVQSTTNKFFASPENIYYITQR